MKTIAHSFEEMAEAVKIKVLERWWVDLLWVLKVHQGPALHSGPLCAEGRVLGNKRS